MDVLFIGGCARSGTTLLAGMLANHPRHCAPQELLFKQELWYMADAEGMLSPSRVIPALRRHLHFRIMMEAVPDAQWQQLPERMHWKALLEWLVQRYAQAAYGKDVCTVWIDHSVSNLEQIHFLTQHFPQARFVHIVRDGRAVAASFKRINWWGPTTVPVAAGWWKEAIFKGIFAEVAFPDRVLRVRYEDLLEHPEEELQHICQWAHLEYHPAMLEGKGVAIHPIFRDQHRYVGAGIRQDRKDRWKKELSAREIEIFEALTAELLQFFHYPLVHDKPVAPSRREWLYYQGVERWASVMQKIRRRLRIRRYLR